MNGHLRPEEARDTASWICSIQLPSGMVPWSAGAHADPWNHVEAAMAMLVADRRDEADRAFEWLASNQLPDGSWCRYYLAEGVEDPRRDPNVSAYIATGAWWHYLQTADIGFLEWIWPCVEGAVRFSLGLQQPGGEVLWSMDPDGRRARYALLTSTSSIHHSLRCAIAIAEQLGHERPEWELAADLMAEAIVVRPDSFRSKDRWAMDWYYPVLSGVLRAEAGRERIMSRWSDFVMDGLGVRCVSDEPWVTAAETAECVMALDAVGLVEPAASLLEWTRHMREPDGSYWTGCVHPQCVRYPGGERTTYTAAAVLLADHALYGAGPAAALFRGPLVSGLRPAERTPLDVRW